MSKEHNSNKSTIIWNYIGTLFNMSLQFMLLPFLLVFLSEEELGVWYVMVSFSNIANLFSFGFTPAFARNVAYCWNGAKQLKRSGKERDVERAENIDFVLLKKILITSQYLYLAFAIVGTVCISLVGTLHIWRIAEDVLTPSMQLGWFVFLIAIFLNIYYGYYSSYLVGIGKVKESNQVIVMSVVCRIAVTVILMFFHFGILGAAIGYLAHGLLLRVLSRSKFYRSKNLKKELEKIDSVRIHFQEMKECFLIVWYNAWRDGIVSVADYLSTQMSTIVCSGFLSLADTAMFSLTAQLVTAVGKIARSIHNAYTPVFQRAYITGDQKTARETQAFCIFTYTLVFLAGIIAVLTIGIPILGIFKPESAINRAVLSGYAIYQFMLSFRNCYAAYMSSTNRVWYWKSYIITSLGIVLVYTVLFMTLGPSVWWIIAVSVIGEGIYNFRKWPGLVNGELGLKFRDIAVLGYNQARGMLFHENDRKPRKW